MIWAAATLVLGLSTAGALACSCVPAKPGDPLPGLVVDATVLAVHRDAANRPLVTAVLRVHRSIRGRLFGRAEVTTANHPAACGVTFRPGERVVLAMVRTGRRFATTTCLNFRYQQQIRR